MSGTLGLFGGSFDPPHHGHVLTACYALAAGEIDALWVVPTFEHPLGKPLTPFAHRMRMCERAFADLRRCEVVDLERQLGGVSYTVELLEAIRRREPGRALRLLVGSDILGQTNRWRDYGRVCELAPPLVVQRSGHRPEYAPEDEVAMPEVSSTELRERLARGERPIGLLPRAVLNYAREHALYERKA